MASQMKISLLHLLVAVLLLCEVLGQRSSSRTSSRTSSSRRTSHRRPVYRPGNIRRKECKDEPSVNATCDKLIKELGYRVCYVGVAQLKAKLERSCAQSCHFCGEPRQNCRTSRYGCCWDSHTSRGDENGIVGCPECKDHLHLCRRFKRFCNARKPENKAFMNMHCPKTCKICTQSKRQKIEGQRVNMADWSKL